MLLLGVAAALLILSWPLPALAQGETIGGTLVYRVGDERTPVEGVTITVSQEGTEVGSATSDAEGRWEVSLPGPGTYQVTIDVATLPEGVALTDPTKVELPNVSVLTGQSKSVIFPLRREGEPAGTSSSGGGGTGGGVSPYARVGALFVSGLKLGATIALAAVGLSLIYGVTRLTNFAHAEMVTLGAVLAFLFHATDGGPSLPLIVAAIPAVILVAGSAESRIAICGAPSDGGDFPPLPDGRVDWAQLRAAQPDPAHVRRPAGLVRGLCRAALHPRPGHRHGAEASRDDRGHVVVLFLVTQFLQRSRPGTAMRAVADDRDLAESSGIDVNRVILITWVLAGGLAALGGIFLGLNESVSYDMGFSILLLLFAAVVLGGLGTAYGVMAGGFVVGIVVEMSTLVLPAELKFASGLIILIVVLLFRPQGIFGTRERIG